MRRYKKVLSFMLVLTLLLGAQAVGFGLKYLQAQIAAGGVSKSNPAVNLESINTKNINPDYINVGKSTLKQNGRQVIKVGLGVDLSNVSKVSLKYQLEGSDEVSVQDTSDIENGYITFAYSLGDKTELGKYNLQSIELKAKDGSILNNVNLEQLAASYTVVPDDAQAAAAEVNAPAVGAASKPDASAVVGVDKNNAITGAEIGAAIEKAKKAMKDETGIAAVQKGTDDNAVKAAGSGVTIVLDPGHGGTETGAVANGYIEKNLNLKIAQYAKAELETYNGVTVGMTRTDDSVVGLEQRAINAQQQGATILVSLHNNASGYGTAYGSEVYVSVLKAYHDSSAALANLILDQLSALGLYDRGVQARASESGTIFTLTGELADYYAVIKYSAYRGFPGIIVEHSFMDNAADAANYLSSDAKLKALGVADAKALADYYGLQKKSATVNVNLASQKTITASAAFNNLALATDGIKTAGNYADSSAATGLQYVQVDLGNSYFLGSINLWHYFGDSRIYKDVVVQLSNDPTFSSGVTTVYNNDTDNSAGLGKGTDSEYAETSAGKSITFPAVNARYARFYSSGSSVNSYSHYGEIEIYNADTASIIHPKSVTMNQTTASMDAGGTVQLTASVLPANTSDNSVTWSSSDTSTATVSASGLVKAVKSGTATIKAVANDGGIQAACIVTVKVPGNLAAGKVATSSAAVTNISSLTDGLKDTNVYYDMTTGLQWVQLDLGTSYNLSDIKLWHYFADARQYHDVVVQVSNDSTFKTGVTTVFNNDTDNSAGLGTGTGGEYAETSAGKDIPVASVNARYARLYSNGNSVNAYNHYVEVEVYGSAVAAVHPTSVSLNKTTDSIAIGATDKLTATVVPATATNKSVTWSSSDATIASVSSDGTVTGLKTGAATITVKTADGGFSATCKVTVGGSVSNLAAGKVATSSAAVTNISSLTDGLKDTNVYYDMTTGLQWVQLDLGTSYNLSDIKLWHYFADARQYHDVVVQVSNDSTFKTGVTTVFNNDTDNSAGLGTGTGSEYAETSAGKDIPVASVNARYARFYSNGSSINAYNHYVEVEVYGSAAAAVHPTAVSLNKTTDSIAIGATDKITPTFTPANTTNKSVTWSSSDATIASVSSDGTVTGLKTGAATITVKTADGGFTATCKVTVVNLAYGKVLTSSYSGVDIACLTDGDKNTNIYYNMATGLQWVQLDLGASRSVNDIKIWHYFGDTRKYHDVIVQLSNDSTFKTGVNTIYNNDANNSAGLGIGKDTEYSETSTGKDIPVASVNARYIRFYSNGSSVNAFNHYVEIEVYGK